MVSYHGFFEPCAPVLGVCLLDIAIDDGPQKLVWGIKILVLEDTSLDAWLYVGQMIRQGGASA